MTKIEYDEKRDRFYLTCYENGSTIHSITPEHLEEMCKKIQDALYERRELLDWKCG